MHCFHPRKEGRNSLDGETLQSLDGKQSLLRVHNGQARMVPRLREAHCLRDSWTKLNVLPAKIMQVNLRLYLKIEMLCDLYNLVLCLCTTCLYSRSKSLVNYFGT